MLRRISNKMCLAANLMMLLFFIFSPQLNEAQRLNELRRLSDELQQSDSLRNADVVVVMSERTVIEAAKQMVGLEIVMSNGGVLQVTSVEGELKPAAATIKIGVQAKSSMTVNMILTGRLGTGEIKNNVFQLPFQITDVALANGRFTALFLKAFLGDWRSSKKWNEELPPIEIPLEISEAMQIPASRINVDGSPAMEISTPSYRSPINFTIVSFFVLDGRLALGLQMKQGGIGSVNRNHLVQASSHGLKHLDLNALENEVARLSSNLVSDGDLRVLIHRRVMSALLEQIAAAHRVDFNIRLKPGRLRAEEINAVVKIQNYTDVEGGEGQADISQLSIERIADGKVSLRLSGQGEVDSRLRGREFGVPYRLSPRTNFVIRERTVPLEFDSEGERVLLRAVPGAILPIDLRFSLTVAGREVGINRNIAVRVDSWLNRVEIPSFFGRDITLPRKLQVDAGGNVNVVSKQTINFGLSRMRVQANNDAVDITAAVAFSAR
jgi:hypothetical protein